MKVSTEVLICGAGAAGLALAIELARRGVAMRVIEQREAPFQGSRGKGIQPRSLEIFEDMGVVNRLFAVGGAYPPTRTHHPDGSSADAVMLEAPRATVAEPYGVPLMVPQFATEQVLRARLAELGHSVAFAHALRDFEQDPDGVTVQLDTPSGPQTVRARYLIGADGGRSTVRRVLQIGFPGKTLGVRAVVADLSLQGLPRDAWHTFNEHDPQQRLMLCPLMGTALFQLQAPVPLEGEVDLSAAGLQAMVQRRSGRDDIVVEEVHWASAYQLNARLADCYRSGNVLLVGDAAHTHPPTGGQGLNTSVQDAYNLGWKLAAVLRGAPSVLLDSYEQERRPIAAAMLGLATNLLERAQQGDHRRGREVQQLDLQYRSSPLTAQADAGVAKVLPGDRIPDARLQGAGGQPARLFDLLRGTHWTLLGHATDRDSVVPRSGLQVHVLGAEGEWRDVHGDIAAALDLAEGHWLLIRPDGYASALGAAAEVERVLARFDACMPAH